MSLFAECECGHSHGGIRPTEQCPECDCDDYREDGRPRRELLEEIERLRSDRFDAPETSRLETLLTKGSLRPNPTVSSMYRCAADEIERLTKLAKESIRWAWAIADQTVACPACGIAWWENDLQKDDIGELEDDWHQPGCEFQALLVALGESTGKRKDVGIQAFDQRGTTDLEAVRRIRDEISLLRKIAEAGFRWTTYGAVSEKTDEANESALILAIGDYWHFVSPCKQHPGARALNGSCYVCNPVNHKRCDHDPKAYDLNGVCIECERAK